MIETNTATENIQREAAIVAKPNLDALSSADFPEYAGIIPEQPKVEEVKKEEPIDADAPAEIKLEEEKKPVVEEVKVEEKKEEELVLEGVKPLELTLETTGPEEGSWLALAKEVGLEGVEEDSFDAIKDALTKPLLEKIETMDNKKMEDYFHDLSPKVRMYIELEKAGISLEQAEAPLKQIQSYRNMSSVELYRQELTEKIEQVRDLSDTDKDWIDSEVAKKVESGDVEHEAKRIHLGLDAWEKQVTTEQNQIIEKYKANKDNFLTSQRNEEVASVTKAMNDMSTLMGKTIPEDIRKQLGVNYSKGEYDQLLKDPQAIAEFIAYKKLGNQITKNIETESFNKGKLEQAKKLHNTPPVTTGGAGTQLATRTGDGNLDNLTAADFV